MRPPKQRASKLAENAAPNFVTNMKTVLGFLQIITSQAFVVEVPWPAKFQSFTEVFDFASLNIVPWTNIECITPVDFYTRLLVILVVPVAVLVLLVGTIFVIFTLANRFDYRDDDAQRRQRTQWIQKTYRLALFTLFLLYPGVSSSVLTMFSCEEVNGTHYMLSNFNVTCMDEQWYRYLPMGLIALVVYPIGIPLCVWCLLYIYRRRLRDPSVSTSMGFLYEAFNEDMWWFELVDMFNKLFLTSLLLFFPASMRMAAGAVMSLLYLMVILLRRPYIRALDERMHLCAYTEVLCFFLAGSVLAKNPVEGDTMADAALSAVLILLSGTVLVLLAFHMYLYSRMSSAYEIKHQTGSWGHFVAFVKGLILLQFCRKSSVKPNPSLTIYRRQKAITAVELSPDPLVHLAASQPSTAMCRPGDDDSLRPADDPLLGIDDETPVPPPPSDPDVPPPPVPISDSVPLR